MALKLVLIHTNRFSRYSTICASQKPRDQGAHAPVLRKETVLNIRTSPPAASAIAPASEQSGATSYTNRHLNCSKFRPRLRRLPSDCYNTPVPAIKAGEKSPGAIASKVASLFGSVKEGAPVQEPCQI